MSIFLVNLLFVSIVLTSIVYVSKKKIIYFIIFLYETQVVKKKKMDLFQLQNSIEYSQLSN